jgi:hypothetical protein
MEQMCVELISSIQIEGGLQHYEGLTNLITADAGNPLTCSCFSQEGWLAPALCANSLR